MEYTKPCEGCGVTICFAQNPKSGESSLPVELEVLNVVPVEHSDPRETERTFAVLLTFPMANGSFILPRARRWRGLETDTATPLRGRVLHFSTCPRAVEMRRQGRRGRL